MEALLNFNGVPRALQFIISVYSIYFLLAYLSSLYSSCESLHECLLALLASDFSAGDCFVDKKMVFLLCNGIILCVSWLPGSESYSAHNLQEDGFGLKPVVKPSFDEKVGGETGTGSSLKVVADLDMDQGQIEEQEHDEEEESTAVPEEESDERFENFIRKMREQIGIVSLPQNVVCT